MRQNLKSNNAVHRNDVYGRVQFSTNNDVGIDNNKYKRLKNSNLHGKKRKSFENRGKYTIE